MKRYSEIVESSLEAQFEKIYEEAVSDPKKYEILISMLEDAGVANTASAPGLAGVSTGEMPPVPATQGGFPILRRKKPKIK